MPWPVIPKIPAATLKENSDARKAARDAKIAARAAARAARPAKAPVNVDPTRVAARKAKVAEIEAREAAQKDPANRARRAAQMKANARKAALKPRTTIASNTAYQTRLAPPMINDMVVDAGTATMWAVYTGTNQIVSFEGASGGDTPTVIAGGMHGLQNGTGTAARFAGPTGLTLSGDYLYVADSGNSAIRKIHTTTHAVTTFKSDLSGVTMITSDSSNLYCTGNNIVYKVSLTSPYAVTLLAGQADGTAGSTDDSVGTDASFTDPRGITVMGGKLYVACGDDSIRTIGLSGTHGTDTILTEINGLYGITNDGSNLYYTADNGVWKLTPDGSGGWNTPDAFAPGNQNDVFDPATDVIGNANLHNPRGIFYVHDITLDQPFVFIADQGNNAIRYTSDDYSQIATIGTPNAHITNIKNACIEHGDYVYFIAYNGSNDSIYKISKSDLTLSFVFEGYWSLKSMTFIGDDLYVTDIGEFNNYVDIYIVYPNETNEVYAYIDGPGDGSITDASITAVGSVMYIATQYAIYKFDTETSGSLPIELNYGSEIAGNADVSDYINGNGTSARFGYIRGITHDATNLYIADNGDVRAVRKMTLASPYTVTTIAGDGSDTGDDVTVGANVLFNENITDITLRGTNLYVANNWRVRKIALSGTYPVTTVAGDPTTMGDLDNPLAGLGTAPYWDEIHALSINSDGDIYVIGQPWATGYPSMLTKLMLNGGGGAVGDPYVTTIHGHRYKLPIADMPIRFYQGMVDGTLLTVNAQLRTTDNADLFAENMRSYLAHKDSMPKNKLKELEFALYSTEKLCFFEKFYIQYGDSEITLNVWDHKFKFESYKGKIASESVDGRGLTNTYSDIYKNYESQTLKFSIGKSATVFISVYPGTMLKNGIFIEAPELSKGNGVLINVLNKSHMELRTLKSLDPVAKKDSKLKEHSEWFLDHDGYRTRNILCA